MKASRSRSLLISCLLALAFGHCVAATAHEPRQISVSPPVTTPTPSPPTTPTIPPKDPVTTPTPPPTTPTDPPTTPSPPPDTNTRPAVTPTPPPSDTSKPNPETSNTPPPPPTTTEPPPNTILSTDSQGVEVTVTETQSATSTSSSESATSTGNKQDDSSGLGIGPIIGMSVAGGIAVIGIIGFFVWKFTRKRFSDFDDNEAIKWPELNSHGGNPDSHPLPVHNTGRSGFDTGSEASLSRVPSSSNYSTPDVGNVGPDPYAVPPLPHLNPNQPYRDDPTATTSYYDPYRGPVPGTLEHGAAAGEWGGEAIPMTQMAGNTGRMSPGAHAAYDPMYNAGRQSPGPQAAYAASGRTPSPGPQAAYGGGRASPGPQAAYTAGRMSPGPHAAYDYGGARQ